jgi:nicotinamidase-related amidase
MKFNKNNIIHVVVDMLYDFIDGSLACKNALNSVENTITYINNNPDQTVLYICDSHPSDHCSFVSQGGPWPPHCVEGTKGQQIHEFFFTKVNNTNSRPNSSNIFKKGEHTKTEEYSGYHAINSNGETLSEFIERISLLKGKPEIIISGIASEFCVKESSGDFHNAGLEVDIIAENLAYVDFQEHIKTLKELEEKGINITW